MKLLPLAAFLLFSSPKTNPASTVYVSPAEQKIAVAERALAKMPKNFQLYNELAMALARRARETSDAAYYNRAEEALEKSFALSPENFPARKVHVWILLGKHEFARARDEARELNRRAPDDVQVYGFLTDSNIELGNYDEAEKAAQWMLDLRPGNVAGLTRGAYLRELFGDLDGAADFMKEAYQQTPPTETEDRAWILTQLAHLQLEAGELDAADQFLRAALSLFPDYHYALENLAKVRGAQKRYGEAAELLERRNRQTPQPESLYALGIALEAAGRGDDAHAAFVEFEQKARYQIGIADNANRELVFYYVDYKHNPAEALRLAEIEVGRRQDVFTLDAYAWALHANGRTAEARRQLDRALDVGTRDVTLLQHATVIGAAR